MIEPTEPHALATTCSLREWYAGQALAGLLSYSPSLGRQYQPVEVARYAVEYADALIAALRKNPE